MENEFAKHEKDFIKIYQEKGFTANFHAKNGKLINSETKEDYAPHDIFIVAEHRYEGMSDPSDLSILYIIKTSHGEKGTFLLGYGPSADLEVAEFFKKIPESNVSNAENVTNKK
ncbi:hypothetical protein APS56_00355 [Pseudalgibacter alginicilyticus]|uniref:Phosphoribosylpyrophosphate synthetase n=1 Tax=Pseudalgibacter alginicilyticus TaxID=1736674 RepID=A0A0P0CHD6_9FLAO|nr:hypothetical protein [Pseudalgibacter alginicilyticus]ALJ03691.1 hypothetical protein APS56_00355 [Pseudalgibacter alginicilyticus]